MAYKDRLMHLKLPTLEYRQFKIMHNVPVYNAEVLPNLRYYPKSNTGGKKYKLLDHAFPYDLRKHFFSARVGNIWNTFLTLLL